ncbi:unnamed protein product [Pleuronectes platessa]|uniref:Uncharacterized protein n=1 Tax=Pleuronectes platessa TaxID=8262 RepID=A0A9N7TH84_PLEPL|nr:unnamed protein product [Pleuronectes platessa]
MKPEISAPAWPTSASEDARSITPGGPPESRASLYSTTQDTDRRLPVVTTASPLNILNHHTLYRNPPQHQAPFGPHVQPNYFEDNRESSSHPSTRTSPTVPSGTAYSTPHNANERASATRVVVKDPGHVSTITSAAATKENHVVRPDQPGLRPNVRPGRNEEETTTTTITTTTVITTMQNPVPCQLNLTGPEGYIEAPPQSSLAFHSTMDCSYIITVYMGYGVEVQIALRSVAPPPASRTRSERHSESRARSRGAASQ